MKKRILSVLLTVVLVVSAVVITATAATYTAIDTPRIVYGEYLEETVTQGTSSSIVTLPLTFKSNIKVAEVGADYIVFSNISDVTDTNLIEVKGTTFYWAKVTDGTPGEYSSYKVTGTTVTEYKLEGLEEGAQYSIYVTSGNLRDASKNNYRFVASDAILVSTVSYVEKGPWPTPVLDVADGKLTGIEDGKSYEYVKLSAPDFAVDEAAYADYDATSTTLEAGLYSVRVKAGTTGNFKYDASEAVVVLAKGENVGSLTFAVNAELQQGTWTLYSDGTYGSAAPGIRTSYKDFATYIAYANKDMFNARSYSYRFKDDELIHANDFFDITVSKSYNMGDLIDTNDDNNLTVYGLATFHVAGASVDSYKVPFTWTIRKTNTIKIDLAGAFPERDGYIYGLDIKLYDETSANNGHIIPLVDYTKNPSNNGTYVYQMFSFVFDSNTRIIYNARVPAAAPVLFAEGTDTEGTYRIYGLDPALNYAISTDGSTYNDVPANSTYAEVTGTGTYYIYAKATDTTYDSSVVSIRIDGAMPAIPEGTLAYENGVITGLDTKPEGYNTVTYEWCRVSIDGTLSWDKTTTTEADPVQVGPGYYAFRYAARPAQNLVAGMTTYVFVYEGGSNKGTVSSIAYDSSNRKKLIPEGDLDTSKIHDFVPGYWTDSSICLTTYNEGANNRLAATYSASKGVETLPEISWRYQFADSEIFTLSELSAFKFSLGFANGNPTNSDYYGYVRIYVAGGDAAYYDVPFVASNNTTFSIDVASIWDDEVTADANFTPDGYVIALEIFYFAPDKIQGVTFTETAINNPSLYPVMILGGHDVTTMRASQFVTLKEEVDITTINSVPAVGTYGGEITGLNPEVVYQFTEYDESVGGEPTGWQFAPIGTYINLPAGTYAVRAYAPATDKQYLSSDYVIVTIDEAPAGDERVSAKVDKLILPDEVELAEADYYFDINESRWINRLALSNITVESPNANIIFEADDYRFTISASDIDLSLDTAHYFDMKVTFDGESAYDRMYPKMAELADEKELVRGIHFESSTEYFFEKATFEVNLGESLDGYDVELRSYNERVNRLRNEETVTVDGGWASFSTFGGDYLILCPALAEE